jgi:MYXO-CTERM domain-containing protein
MRARAAVASRLSRAALVLSLGAPAFASAATRAVGPGKTYAAPCAAFAAASDNDVIEIDAAGDYDGDVCGVSKNGLTIRGASGKAKIDAAGKNAQGKAIWVISGNDTTVENIQFTGAKVPDLNGAGIRQEGKNLTVRGCVFRDNENGILAGDNPDSHILIEGTEFDHNGAGDGYSHNLYINHVGKLTFQFNWSHRAQIGHLLKTRAAENRILYNRLTGEDGTQSYEIDVPNGGTTYVIGNIVQQGAATDNPSLLAYQQEGTHASNPGHDLHVVNNTFVNDRAGNATFVAIGGSVTTKAVIRNNILSGSGVLTNQAGPVASDNVTASDCFVDALNFDYHLVDGAPCVDAGMDPGSANGFDLAPALVYVHPAASAPRVVDGPLDVGAYELQRGGADAGATPGTGGTSAGGGGADAGGSSSAGGASAGGASGSPASGGASAASGGSGAATGGSPSSGGSSGAPDGGADATPQSDDSGCDCRVAGGARSGAQRLVALAALALCVARRRRKCAF